jgi:hypothetical protein
MTAYSHKVSSIGFWPGNEVAPAPMFYAYFAPEPPGCGEVVVKPAEALYSKDLGEFLLPYEVVRKASDPARMLLDFCQSIYEAGANLAK